MAVANLALLHWPAAISPSTSQFLLDFININNNIIIIIIIIAIDITMLRLRRFFGRPEQRGELDSGDIGQDDWDKLPPPYSDDPTVTPNGPSTNHVPMDEATKRALFLRHFRLFILEILAFTFDADFSKLRAALGQRTLQADEPASILTELQRHCLLLISHRVRAMYWRIKNNQWDTVPVGGIYLINRAIIEPTAIVPVETSYALELIATYADHQCEPDKRGKTLVSYHEPRHLRRALFLSFFLCTPDFADTLRSHAKVISAVSPDERVRFILSQAQQDFERNLGLRRLPGVEKLPLAQDGMSSSR
ncbi:hypothetical protein BDV96DRAFT_647872 [Lophiotrema nucula]|uniref:Uncharacterized protein n=1 Tax=Lophiotrema nucula TaxID=690887 RepID=A0A6A5Z2F1_9PLEO|nr:hypothetical protein BDV96DRAFT_647872 [Lophiotrema nucula]